jgi:hypothetical protein
MSSCGSRLGVVQIDDYKPEAIDLPTTQFLAGVSVT